MSSSYHVSRDTVHVSRVHITRCLLQVVVAGAASAGVDVVTGAWATNWDYLQSVFFATTVLTTIGSPVSVVVTRCSVLISRLRQHRPRYILRPPVLPPVRHHR